VSKGGGGGSMTRGGNQGGYGQQQGGGFGRQGGGFGSQGGGIVANNYGQQGGGYGGGSQFPSRGNAKGGLGGSMGSQGGFGGRYGNQGGYGGGYGRQGQSSEPFDQIGFPEQRFGNQGGFSTPPPPPRGGMGGYGQRGGYGQQSSYGGKGGLAPPPTSGLYGQGRYGSSQPRNPYQSSPRNYGDMGRTALGGKGGNQNPPPQQGGGFSTPPPPPRRGGGFGDNGGTATNGMDINPPRGGMGGSMGGKGGMGNTRGGGGMGGQYQAPYMPTAVDTGESNGGTATNGMDINPKPQIDPASLYSDPNMGGGGGGNDDQVIYRGGSKGFYDRNPGQFIDLESLSGINPLGSSSDPNMGGGGGERMVRGPNGNMYKPNELPSNMRMEVDTGPRAAISGPRAVFADDYILKPSDQGYMTNDLPRPMLNNAVPQKPQIDPASLYSDPNMGMGGKGGQQLPQMRTQGPESLRMQGTPLQQIRTQGPDNIGGGRMQPQPMPSIFAPQQPSGPPAQPAFQGTLGNQIMRQVFNQPDNLNFGGGDLQRQQAMAMEAAEQFMAVERPAMMSGIGSMGQIRRR